MLSWHAWPRNEVIEHTYAPLLITSVGDGSRLDIAGELDVLTTPKMVNAALCSPADRDLTLSLSRVVFIDAVGLLARLSALLTPRTSSSTVLDQLTGAVLQAVRVAQPIR